MRSYVCKGACHCCCAQVVKGYEQGKLSKHIVGLKEGDTLEFKGPVMKLTYKPNMRKAIGMARPTDGTQPGTMHQMICSLGVSLVAVMKCLEVCHKCC